MSRQRNECRETQFISVLFASNNRATATQMCQLPLRLFFLFFCCRVDVVACSADAQNKTFRHFFLSSFFSFAVEFVLVSTFPFFIYFHVGRCCFLCCRRFGIEEKTNECCCFPFVFAPAFLFLVEEEEIDAETRTRCFARFSTKRM